METIFVDSVSDLEHVLGKYGPDVVYRGQTKNYLNDDGMISLTTSFQRNGCIPPLMLKWSHYAQLIYRAGAGDDQPDLAAAQALLQHYGWRSFYLDFSSSPGVASWFAANQFGGTRTIQLAEDCFELPVHLSHFIASYENSTTNGHMYVVDLAVLEKDEIGYVRLHPWTEDSGALTRMDVQKAVLIGPVTTNFPASAIACHIEAPSEVFRQHAARAGANEVSDLFPTKSEDPVLRLFLSVPWEQVGESFDIGHFCRGLDLPIYKREYEKIYSACNAFYKPLSIGAGIDPEEHENLSSTKFFSVEEDIYYYRSDSNIESNLEGITEELREYGSIVLEASGIIRRPEFYSGIEYDKGVYLKLHSSNLVEICSLTIEHPGTHCTGFGITQGWFYEIDDDYQWHRVIHADECPCDNEFHHLHQIDVVRIFEQIRKEPDDSA